MKQTKKWALAVTVSGMALVLCSCSTAASNANRYFTSAGAIATNLSLIHISEPTRPY